MEKIHHYYTNGKTHKIQYYKKCLYFTKYTKLKWISFNLHQLQIYSEWRGAVVSHPKYVSYVSNNEDV